MRDYIKIAIETINDETKGGPKFAFWENVRQQAQRNALLYTSANRLADEDAVALSDFTVLKSGEDGCVISKDGMYFNRIRDKIQLAKLKNASAEKKNIVFTMDDGEKISVKVGKAAEYITAVANEIVRLRDGGQSRQVKKEEVKSSADVVIVQKSKSNPFSFKLYDQPPERVVFSFDRNTVQVYTEYIR
ncbi:MAG: hypothetical protein IKU13_03105 [Clostridia bacterium]|nr:hypothetical protein [Clostridia bacterium]